MSPPQRTPRERKKPETYVPDLGQSSASSEGMFIARAGTSGSLSILEYLF